MLGNRLFTGLLAGLFGRSFSDIFSGYRVFSRRFVKSFPVLSSGFEIETEISVHALELRMPVGEVETALRRASGRLAIQAVHLSRWLAHPDARSCTLYRIERPVLFYGSIGALLVALPRSCSPSRWSSPMSQTGLVPRFPTAILVTGMTIIAVLCFFAGLILDTVTRGRREVRRARHTLRSGLPNVASRLNSPLFAPM